LSKGGPTNPVLRLDWRQGCWPPPWPGEGRKEGNGITGFRFENIRGGKKAIER